MAAEKRKQSSVQTMSHSRGCVKCLAHKHAQKIIGSNTILIPPSCVYKRQVQGLENEVSGDP